MAGVRQGQFPLTTLVAAVMVAGGLILGTGAVQPAWLDAGVSPGVGTLAAGSGVAALASLLRLRVRIDSGLVELPWGEAAVMILCHLLPPGWIPAAVLVGAGGVQAGAGLLGRRGGTGPVPGSVSALTVAVSVAALLGCAVGPTYDRPLSARTAIALLTAATTYWLITTYLIARRIDRRVDRAAASGPGASVGGHGADGAERETGRRPARGGAGSGVSLATFGRVANTKLLMVVGNLTVGLLAAAVEGSWLVLLPPLVWLLQQTYAYRLRLDDERRTWHLFSEVSGQLNRLDEREAAAAGVFGSLRLFPAATMAEIAVTGVNGGPRAYAAERGRGVAEVTQGTASATGESAVAAAGPAPAPSGGVTTPGGTEGSPVVTAPATRLRPALGRMILPAFRSGRTFETHPLMAEGAKIGELRLWIGPKYRFTRRDRLMLSAYGDALAAALHDAATHQELRSIVDRGSYEAMHDPLTGMVNRGALLARGNSALRRLAPQAPVALLLLDVNHFKEVNNTLGHAAGDELLQVIALRLGAAVRADETLARLGGDEFAVLLMEVPPPAESERGAIPSPSPSTLDYAIGRARRLAEQVAAPTEICGVVLSVEASVGVVTGRAGDVDMTELLRRADIAMYQAKRGTRGVAWYEPSGDESSVDRLALLAELREALGTRDQLTVVLQPMVSLDTGALVAVEALARWRHPRRGWLEPDEFLDAVEHSELVGPFTRYILDLALQIEAGWISEGIEMPIAVNLSARSLLDPTLAEELPRLLQGRHVPPERLTLEITESVVLSELATVEEVLAALRAVGVRIAVDDFGSGFSSLTFLTRVPVDEVKIDRAFVARMVESAEAAAIVRTTVDLGRQLGLRVVAEGVESSAQRLALVALGCVAAQGYHFYRPLPPERMALILASTA